MSTALCWFRRDLRLEDNPAWAAATRADRVLAVYVIEPTLLDRAGPFRRRAMLGALRALADDIEVAGGRLHVLAGDPAVVLASLVADIGAECVHANADVGPWAQRRDRAVEATVPVVWYWGGLVQPPGSVLTAKGTLSQVFTPFHRRWEATPLPSRPRPGDATVIAHVGGIDIPVPDASPPQPAGTDAAHDRLAHFCEVVDDYIERRDFPDDDGTSSLSTDLRFGTLGPRTVIDVVGTHTPGRAAFIRQLAWRDWYAHHLLRSPESIGRSIRPEFDEVAWRDDQAGFDAWKQGRTGYPLVDAGMRQLATTGWMHNRVRMITASFLVKDLLIDWRRGERWFRHLLTDGDVAQNVGNWQWAAGTGHDAAPYFRIFNPVAQSERFDPAGGYIRRWVPELSSLPRSMIHAPWAAAPLDLAAAGVVLGADYPAPIVDHAQARDRTLAAYKSALHHVP